MSAQSDAASHVGIADAAVIPVQRVVGVRHAASEMSRTDAIAAQGRPTCLLAIALHEIGRTADTLRAAQATGDEALATRVEREQEGWSHLYEFTCQHICPVARMEAIEPLSLPQSHATEPCESPPRACRAC